MHACTPPTLLVDRHSFLFAEATVVGVLGDEEQGTTAIVLDRTVFHPQGGGQPSDHGTFDQLFMLS